MEGARSGQGLPRDRIFRVSDRLYAEHVRALRAKLETRMASDALKVVAVTSSVAGEGKTLLAANLGLALASAGACRICLVDTDLRKSDLHGYFNVSGSPGLADYLKGGCAGDKIVRQGPHPNLFLVTGGTAVEEPADLLAGERFRIFVDTFVRKHFYLVLFDTAPILPVADTLALRPLVDGFLLVFRAGFTPRALLEQAAAEIGDEKILGVVLNGVDSRAPHFYHKYYGRYYHGKSSAPPPPAVPGPGDVKRQ